MDLCHKNIDFIKKKKNQKITENFKMFVQYNFSIHESDITKHNRKHFASSAPALAGSYKAVAFR